ncbi:hypothetical protein QBC47DRAFT_364010 [Echria macrotheca]|uniref:BHLH domain-containing protein n=1 Tax=Echria macrotheca TaxID=438768 RepID=A0AAJ0B4P7_9PEZI|nr:hypothetical protein QBC47DRAFT_364010 [Echria macrotheca]
MEESEHLIEGGGFRAGEQDWSTGQSEGSGLAFPFTGTHIGPPTTGFLSGVPTTCSVASPGLNAPSPIFDRRSPASDFLCSSEGSPAVSAPSNSTYFEYAPQQNFPSPYLSNYVSPVSIQGSSSSGYDSNQMINPETGLLGDEFGTGLFESMALPSPSGFADAEISGVGEYGRTVHQLPQRSAGIGDGNEGPSDNKRGKTSMAAARGLPRTSGRPLLAAGPVAGPSNAGPQNKSKLRSASRTSKNVVHRPDESTTERKTRDAHNLVEKQYRNRLNAQFEALLNTLPDSLRSPGGTLDPNSPDVNMDLGEKRLSKGDVLELATRYIRMLERDCGRLEQERNDLTRDVERLRSMFVNQSGQLSDRSGGEGLG